MLLFLVKNSDIIHEALSLPIHSLFSEFINGAFFLLLVADVIALIVLTVFFFVVHHPEVVLREVVHIAALSCSGDVHENTRDHIVTGRAVVERVGEAVDSSCHSYFVVGSET